MKLICIIYYTGTTSIIHKLFLVNFFNSLLIVITFGISKVIILSGNYCISIVTKTYVLLFFQKPFKFFSGKIEQCINFFLCSLEVIQAESVHGNFFNT